MHGNEPTADVDRLAHDTIGAAIEVHRELGPGLHESNYGLALCHELELRGISHQRQPEFKVYYKGQCVGTSRVDVWVDESLVVELKSVEAVAPVHKAQVNTYLKLTRCTIGLLINFNVPVLKDGITRIINSQV